MARFDAAFDEQYSYDGPLGAQYSSSHTTLRLWAPTATAVETVIYSNDAEETQAMERCDRGVWELTLPSDRAGTHYNYRLTFPDGSFAESTDPYARAVTANGARTVVVDPEIGDAGTRMLPFSSPLDAIIYEAHIRDLTIAPDNGIANKGKFLGLTETGTRTSNGNLSGLDYLTSLGITHVQLLPIYDFGSVDELGDLSFNAQYNWGYDPVNYNVPEGSYATNPADPMSRITELKTLVRTLHDNGLRVVMDVVYNHVYSTDSSPLEKTVPGYFFRKDDDGNFCDATACGSETASERAMVRRYIVDSVTYWARTYNLDGFRFDLMGIHDVATMNAVREALNEIDPSIIVIGEGWDMGNHPEGVQPANYFNASAMPGIAHFNDEFRDAMKGRVFDPEAPGFVSGADTEKSALAIYTSITGAQGVRDFASPAQSVIYNEAHDNHTMFDKLALTLPGASDVELLTRHMLATAIQYLANGIIFIHAGQELLRTKGGLDNSFASPDEVNFFDYDRAATFARSLELFRALNRWRRTHVAGSSEAWMKVDSYADIEERYQLVHADAGRLAYRVDTTDVMINATAELWSFGETLVPAFGIITSDSGFPQL